MFLLCLLDVTLQFPDLLWESLSSLRRVPLICNRMKYGDEMINELFLVFSTFNFLEYVETSQPGVKFPKQQPKWTFGCWTCPEIRDFCFFLGGGKNLAGL